MSDFGVYVVTIKGFGKHPDADNLSIASVFGSPVVFRTGSFNPGDKAIYVPVDAVVPLQSPMFAFLDAGKGRTTERIRAKKLRGIFSMGLLIPIPTDGTIGIAEGVDLSGPLGVAKYEEPEPLGTNGPSEKDPGGIPVYNVESLRKYRHLMREGEEVVLTEKLHGCNGRFCHKKRATVRRQS